MLRFEMDVSATDLRARTIEGTVVPYGEVARINGKKIRFQPGSLALERPRTPLLIDHDRGAPVGVLAELVDSDAGALGRFSIDETAAGDTALVQAASGSRGSLSVGAEVVKSVEADGGVIDVLAARVVEVSLLAFGAFAGATVTRVAAEADDEPEPEPEPADDPNQLPLPDDEPAPPAEPEPEEGTSMSVESTAPAPMILAEREPAPRELSAGEMVGYIVRAQHGDRDAARYIEAALTETLSTDVSGLLPPTYERNVIGGKEVDRPLYTAFRSRPLPGVGLQVNKPKWTAPPAGNWAANVDADATSTKVTIGSQAATVQRWDWAGAISWVVVQRSDPSIIDEIYAQAVQDFYLDVEAKVGGQLTPAAAGVATKMGAAIAEFYVATGNQRTPELIIMAPDVWGKFADAGQLTVPMATGGVSATGTLTTSFAGIPVIVSGTLAAGSTVLATRRAVDARITEPVRLTANAIGALNVELAVVGEGLFDTDYPAELLKFAAIVPTVAETGARSK